MADEQGAPGSESGKEFREKFEATQAENAALRAQIAGQFGVDAEQLKGVPADQIVSKANEIVAAEKAAKEAAVREYLGLGEDADLEAALAKVRGEGGEAPAQQDPKPASNPFVSTGSLGGTPPPAREAPQGVTGVDRIAAALETVK